MLLAPVVLFVFNRPFHTKQVLDSLAANAQSADSLLYVYCDGPKPGANEELLNNIKVTRTLIKNETRFKEVIIIEHEKNKGLANSVIDGVSEVINKHGKVIVLEDDLVLSPFFLGYMNDSLERYEFNNSVGQIGACNFFACGKKFPELFFIPIPDCLGWGTWKTRWDKFNSEAGELLKLIKDNDLVHKFNAYGSYNMMAMLQAQVGGNGTSWAVRWTAVCILNNWLTLYPNPSITNHVQSDTATNANIDILPPLCLLPLKNETIEVVEIPNVIKAMKRGYSNIGDHYGNLKKGYYRNILIKKVTGLLKTFIKKLFHGRI